MGKEPTTLELLIEKIAQLASSPIPFSNSYYQSVLTSMVEEIEAGSQSLESVKGKLIAQAIESGESNPEYIPNLTFYAIEINATDDITGIIAGVGLMIGIAEAPELEENLLDAFNDATGLDIPLYSND